MTMILALGNRDQVIQISDRRLSSTGRPIEDESNKVGIMFCLNARLAFGFTGLATYRGFKTIDWLLKALVDSGPPTFTAYDIIERLRENATRTFLEHPHLKIAPNNSKKLSIMFSGYVYGNGKPMQGNAVLSNYVNLNTYHQYDITQDQFRVKYFTEIDAVQNPTFIQRIGNWHGITDNDLYMLRQVLVERKPRSAIVDIGISFMRGLANRDESAKTIGKQLTSIYIPPNLKEPPITQYHSNIVVRESFMPAQVFLLPDRHGVISEVKIEPVEDSTPPLSIPKVSKNTPCPCGSGLRYKKCHGKWNKTKKT